MAYFYYKGFIKQDYRKAAILFKKGAKQGRANSAYFLGLMYMNGYAVTANVDSGRYWLSKAAAQRYDQAIQELKMRSPENNDSAKALLGAIKNIAVPAKIPLNQFVLIEPEIPDSIAITGHYNGYVITYDWSGKHVVSARKLRLALTRSDEGGAKTRIKGYWQEQGGSQAPFQGYFDKGRLIFDSAQYSRTDHYSPQRAITYKLQTANLHLVKHADSVFLTGDIGMFSPQRNEPAKPTIIAMVKTDNLSGNVIGDQYGMGHDIKGTDSLMAATKPVMARLLMAYPNPFTTYINIKFEVLTNTKVALELYTLTGQRVYQKKPEQLVAGKYKIQIPTEGTLSGQTYVLRLLYKGGNTSVKLLRY